MRIPLKDIPKRAVIKFDKSIKPDHGLGFMRFGENNDYPQKVERIINSSVSAKSVRDIYARFLIGQGFNAEINNVVVGKDSRGKNITILKMLRFAAKQIATFSGVYIHSNFTLEGKVANTRPVPFKNCRFRDFDDNGFVSEIGVYDNWEKDPDNKKNGQVFDKTKIRWYNVFNVEKNVLLNQIKKAGDIKKFKGQIFFGFLDDDYLYPLSPFDSVLMDCDTENQVSIYKNNMTRNGMTNKTVLRMVEPSNEEDSAELIKQIQSWQGAEGDNVLVVYDEFDETGNIKPDGAFQIDSIDSTIDDALFENWQKELTNNIRKAAKALPAILIDYEESKLGTTSGEAIQQATNFYNSMTKDDRSFLSELFKEIYSNFNDEKLSSNVDWSIKQLDLYGSNTNTGTASIN